LRETSQWAIGFRRDSCGVSRRFREFARMSIASWSGEAIDPAHVSSDRN
jgi:hypothetical protein